MKRKLIYISLFLLGCFTVQAADAVQFTASAPSTVILDKPFQLVYSVNASCKDLRAPEFKYFDILAGPFESHSSSIQYVNGQRSSTVSVSFTYTLQAQKTGTFTVPSASITVNGQKVNSNGLSIKVLPADDNSAKSQRGQTGNKASDAISNENVFIKTQVSKSSVYEQEGVLVTYKLYTLADVVQCSPKKMPDFNGFLKQDIEQPQNKQMSYENYNGKNYATVVMYQTLLYPQRTGVIEIDKINFEAVIRVQNRAAARSIFDDFFDSYSNVSKNITASSAKVTVSALPANKPASFNGTVGRFDFKSSISANEIKANEAVTIKITISGNGNLKLIKTPVIKFPDGFETYDPKVTNNFKTTTSGVSGSKTIEYLFIPRHNGDYEIPAVEFSYFDTQEKKYKTMSSPLYKLQVLKGADGEEGTVVSNYAGKEDLKLLANDIRYIQTADIQLCKDEETLFGTFTFWSLYLVPILLSLLAFILLRKQLKDNADILAVKNRKANKIALKRLKVAKKFLDDGNKQKFYEEVMKAVWTYLSDKLSIPVAALTKESVTEELTRKGIDAVRIERIMNILNTCEYARYAPNTGQQEMGNLYEETIAAISDQLVSK